MRPTTIKKSRRRELLHAALRIMKRDGLRGVTLSTIAKEAGVSRGIVHHYFESKRSLIELTMRSAHAERSAKLARRLRRARSSSERLWAVLSVILDEQYLQPGFCKAWVSFKAESFSDPGLARLHNAIHRRERSNLVHALLPFLPKPQAANLAIAMKALIEGYRFRLAAVPPQNFDSRIVVEQVLAYLLRRAPSLDFPVAARR